MAIKNANIWGVIYTRHCKVPTIAIVIKAACVLLRSELYWLVSPGNWITEFPQWTYNSKPARSSSLGEGDLSLFAGYKNILIKYPF